MDSKGVSLQRPTDIIYGGTFDPPHAGHRLVVERVIQLFPEAQVRVLPAAVPAGAYGQHKTPRANFEHRLAMCGLLLGDCALIDPIEASLSRPNYTVRTVEALDQRHPHRRWAMVLGRDQLESFAAWYLPDRLIEKVSLLVIERDAQGGFENELDQLALKLGRKLEAVNAVSWRWEGLETGIFSLGQSVSPAASRLIRADLERASEDGWLANDVYTYIKRHRLYTERGA